MPGREVGACLPAGPPLWAWAAGASWALGVTAHCWAEGNRSGGGSAHMAYGAVIAWGPPAPRGGAALIGQPALEDGAGGSVGGHGAVEGVGAAGDTVDTHDVDRGLLGVQVAQRVGVEVRVGELTGVERVAHVGCRVGGTGYSHGTVRSGEVSAQDKQ